ncbi:transposase, partial [Paracoccus bogoriensis]|uniref:transposase n=1 Tax=Paracoccus bogoriensis TaxID=242065 RepID=UPI0031B9ACA6
MSNLLWLTDEQIARLRPFFPKSHGRPRADDQRVLSGIIFINRNGLRWCDAPSEYGPPKTLSNRWVRWSRMGVFARIMESLASEGSAEKVVMIDATYLKAHRTASSLRVSEADPKSVHWGLLKKHHASDSLSVSADGRLRCWVGRSAGNWSFSSP